MRIVVFVFVCFVSSTGISQLRDWHCGEELYTISTEAMLNATSILQVERHIQDALLTRKPGQWNVFVSQYARNEAAFIQMMGGARGNAANVRLQNPNLCIVLDTTRAWILMVAKTDNTQRNKAKYI